ncbi:hypothetical protein E0H80_02330 [Acinetobacter sp. ANC 4779]|uniref:hypothetical protein n=1 Tax=Acinetobacter sp. ANC 4779 TaxID=2529848 RepID=UPI001039FC7B|nr:hypothetical protein [Acinetobacter sp. ANC 4779]TCB52692.1 hypothetical protein E0H80_02330 [Acinetobacter sp. ANC 4779]
MEFINPIAAIIALIVAIFSIPKTLHVISEQKRKKFRDELDFYKEYFENYYQKKDSSTPLLVRDKAAHTLTRSIFINAKLANYFVELHENGKVDFQKVIDTFHFGHKYIDIDDQNLIFKPTIKRLLWRRNLYYFSIIPLIVYIYVLYGTEVGDSLHIVLKSLGALFTIILIIQLLDKTLNLEEAEKFLKIINAAQDNTQFQAKIGTDPSIDLVS